MAGTLILGGGFGGITVATKLRRLLGDEHEITLVDRSDHFVMGLRKLWTVVGIGTLEEGSRALEKLSGKGIRVLRREITGIDPEARRVTTDQGTLEADHLVVALGAEPRPDLVPGLESHAHNVWDATGVPGLMEELARFGGGHIVVVIAGVPYACPPAPFECAMLLDDHLRERGLRDRTRITVVTLQPMLLPNAGKTGSEWLGEQLSARGIEFEVGRKTQGFADGRVLFSDDELAADLIVAVPPHRVPAVVRESELAGEGGWVEVDPGTLETGYRRVFAIGDVTRIELANGLPLPKAGIMAELEGQRVAAAIAADVLGETPPPVFDGKGFCFLEMGKSSAALIQGEFFAEPEPRVTLSEPSARTAEEKRRFEAERLESWFEG